MIYVPAFLLIREKPPLFAAVAVPLGEHGVLGVSAISLGTDEQEVTTVEQPEGTGVYYDVSDIAIGLSYARMLTDRFSVGLTLKYIQQNAYNVSASAVALDIGTYLRTGFRNLVIAMMDVIGKGEPFLQSEYHRLTLAVDGNHPNDNVERLNFGGEYAWNETFFVRLGYKLNYDVEKWTAGAGVRANFGSQHARFDYAFVDYSQLGKVSRFSLELGF